MQAVEGLSLEQIRAFLEASDAVGFKGRNREEVYGYRELKRRSRGLVRRYLEKFTGLSRAQITRLIAIYLKGDAGTALVDYLQQERPTSAHRKVFLSLGRGSGSSAAPTRTPAHGTFAPGLRKAVWRKS